MTQTASKHPFKPRFKKGDQVKVIAGKAKGQSGEVLRVDLQRQVVFIKEVNLQMHHKKARRQTEAGGIIPAEGPIHLSNVLNWCPHCERGVRHLCKNTAECKYYQKD